MTRGRDPRSSAAQDGKPVQLVLLGGLGPVMPSALHRHPLYCVWSGMKARCGNPKMPSFKHYGRRGITVCAEWQASSRAFVAWALSNGWQPGLQLDRRDNDGPYSPANCRFVTRKVNVRNRRDTIRGPDGSALADHAETLGMSRAALVARLARGIPWGVAVSTSTRQDCRMYRLSDGRPAWPLAQAHGLSRACFHNRLRRGWSPDQAAGIAPPPPRGRNASRPKGRKP